MAQRSDFDMGADRAASAISASDGKARVPDPHCGVVTARDVENSMGAFDRDRKPEPKRSIGFVGRSVLPGESQEEFDCLEDNLYEEYGPEGPVEEGLVETIANAIWRKRHMDMFYRAFRARMIWGSFFSYPGDPDGDSKITQAYVERTSAPMVKEIVKFATAAIKRKMEEDPDYRGKIDEGEKIAASVAAPAQQEDSDHKSVAAAFTGNDDVTKTILGIITEKAFYEVKKMHRPRTNHREIATNIDSIIEGVVKKELAAEEITPRKDAPLTVAGWREKMWDQFQNTMVVVDSALGAGVVEEILRNMVDTVTEQALAELGDLLTPEHALEELRFAESLDVCVERAHDRLMKVQDRRAKKAAVNVVTLQPGWATRKR
jgi:hypothetical protein